MSGIRCLAGTIERMARVGADLAAKAARVIEGRDIVTARELRCEDGAADHLHREVFSALPAPGIPARSRSRST